MPSQAKKPTVIVLNRPRRVVVKEMPSIAPSQPGTDRNARVKNKVIHQLKRLHPMD